MASEEAQDQARGSAVFQPEDVYKRLGKKGQRRRRSTLSMDSGSRASRMAGGTRDTGTLATQRSVDAEDRESKYGGSQPNSLVLPGPRFSL
jgi:hypothetical protein